MGKEYQGFIFSNHALERINDRSLTMEMVAKTLQHPDKTYPADKPNMTKFIRTLHKRKVHVVASYLPDTKKWLVVSTWVRGEDDKVPLSWQIITAPFRFTWWLLKLPFTTKKRK
ncbi:MAG: DUF4258 domain-containing protein [bacterium]|nr:DUF4258 domain-containing protein [bacterium]